MQSLRARTLAIGRRLPVPDDTSGVERGRQIDELLRHASAHVAAVVSHTDPHDAVRVVEAICALQDAHQLMIVQRAATWL